LQSLAGACNPWDGFRKRTTQGQGDGGKTAGQEKGEESRQTARESSFMDPDVIRKIKSAAALHDMTPSQALEEAAKERLERNPEIEGQGKKR
jgi:hypothetical protein